jgi:hypothetical protein
MSLSLPDVPRSDRLSSRPGQDQTVFSLTRKIVDTFIEEQVAGMN